MIGLVEDIMIPDIPNVYSEYTAMVKEEDKPYMSVRGWDYDAEAFHADLKNTDIVLDIGGACSYFFIYLSRFVKESWCIDPIFSYAERWAVPWLQSLKHYPEYTNGRARLAIQNAKKLPFPDNYFDKILTTSAMEHFEEIDDVRCANEIYRVLKPSGLFIGTVDFNWYKEYMPEKHGEARFYTYQSLWDRVITPSGLHLVGPDFLKGKEPPRLEVSSDEKYKIQPIFFKLRKDL